MKKITTNSIEVIEWIRKLVPEEIDCVLALKNGKKVLKIFIEYMTQKRNLRIFTNCKFEYYN